MKSIENPFIEDPFLKDLSVQIGKLQRHQERFSGFETEIRLEITLREKWKTRARNYGQLRKGINVGYDIDEEALAGLNYKKELQNNEESMLHSLQQRCEIFGFFLL